MHPETMIRHISEVRRIGDLPALTDLAQEYLSRHPGGELVRVGWESPDVSVPVLGTAHGFGPFGIWWNDEALRKAVGSLPPSTGSWRAFTCTSDSRLTNGTLRLEAQREPRQRTLYEVRLVPLVEERPSAEAAP